MSILRRASTPSERELVGLADGSLRGQRRAEVEHAVDENPRLRAAVDAQRRVLKAIEHTATEPAPHALRARLALAHPPSRPKARNRVRGLAAVGTAALGAVAAGVIVGISSGGAVAQASVLQAARVSTRAPQLAVNVPIQGHALPAIQADGLSYPYWDRFGFNATGVRYDRLGGRRVTTVFYARGSSRVAYEIVSGSPLELGGPAANTWHHDLLLQSLRSQQGPVVTWVRHGHTCVLVGQHTALPVLLKLAAWRDGGRIPY